MKIENITFIAEESSKNMVLVFCGNCINPFSILKEVTQVKEQVI